jgi:nucleotide-binding universal stress UspA family protein
MSTETPIVLAATTLAPSSDVVLRTAAAVARRLGAALHVAHAFYVSDLPEGEEAEALPELPNAGVSDYGAAPQAELERQLDRLGLGDTVAELHCEPGSPHRVIAHLAERLGAELVVVGGAEGEAARRRGLGSTASRLLARVACPVLVVHREPALPPERVMATVDLSDLSAEALAGGLALVERLAGGVPPRLEVVLALDPRRHRPLGRLTDEAATRRAGPHLERFVAAAVPHLANRVQRVVVAGDPAVRLVREIAAAQPDVVVLGTHGRGGFERFLLGSVAAEVAAQAPKTALVVPPAAARRAAAGERRDADWTYVADAEPTVPD